MQMAQADVLSAMPQQRIGRPADPCTMVIFGAAGDLTRRKLIPALYNLATNQLLSREFAVVGVARTQISEDEFRKRITNDIQQFASNGVDRDLWEWFLRRLHYVHGDFKDSNLYPRLKETLDKVDAEHSTHGNHLYYLATAADYFGPIVEQLAGVGLMHEGGEHGRRVIVEKPFGHDLESAKNLNQQLLKVADERQIYRIDHYLGKETVQNILAFRFANGIFEPIWNRRYIDHVQITVAETVGVESRGGYYETSGALRDMVQNHMFQLLAFTAMEPPISFAADVVRDERTKVLYAIRPLTPEDVLHQTVRGRYGEGMADGNTEPAYRAEKNVSPTSNVETYVALKLYIDNWRWGDVP